MQEKIRLIENTGQLWTIGEDRKNRINAKWRKTCALTISGLIVITLLLFLVGGLVSGSVGDFLDGIAQRMISSGFFDNSSTPDSDIQNPNEAESESNAESEGDESESEAESLPTLEDIPESDSIGNDEPETDVSVTDNLYSFDYDLVPDGESAIIPMDLSLSSNGVAYINNSTGYKPDVKGLLSASLKWEDSLEYISKTDEPLVLILHTHATEAYSPEGAISYIDDGGEIARSRKKEENVVAVGALLSDLLEKQGIETVHCTIMHDSVQYRDSYSRAEETIKEYLARYPSIKLVIDLHRDGIMKSNGELVRPVTLVDGKETAQVMCVVGSDWGGDRCDNWQNNLSLALKLREKMNSKYVNLCRPTDLRPNTYNQELSRYSLLLEIGSCGNSLTEAMRAAEIVAYTLGEIIAEM